jgi:hypothetical protein
MHVKEATGSNEFLAPSCCGKPIPGAVLETVLSKGEMEDLMNGLIHTYRVDSDASSIDIVAGTQSAPPEMAQSKRLQTPVREGPTEEDMMLMDCALQDLAFQSLRIEQEEEMSRFILFEQRQRTALATHYERTRETMRSQHLCKRDECDKRHDQMLEQLEERQVTAELELRKTHEEEAQKVATGLKYMERYCNEPSVFSPGPSLGQLIMAEPPDARAIPPRHHVTDEDRNKLQRQYMLRDNLPQKHEAAISVLRAKQDREMRMRQEKNAKEMEDLEQEYERAVNAIEGLQRKEEGRLDALIESRKRRLIKRWELKGELWRRDYETRAGVSCPGRILFPHWPESAPDVQEQVV